MNIKKLGLFLLITAAFMMVTPVCADIATFDSVSSPVTAMVGEVVTVDVVISYDFDQLTLLSPGVYYLVEDDYMVEEFIEVTGSGTEAVSLSFNAPNVPGEYVFIVDLYYQEGEDWYNAGQENYYITLTVDGGGSVGVGGIGGPLDSKLIPYLSNVWLAAIINITANGSNTNTSNSMNNLTALSSTLALSSP